jgi:hypothetical protein
LVGNIRHHSVKDDSSIRHFEQGVILPKQLVERYHPLTWPFSDKITRSEQALNGACSDKKSGSSRTVTPRFPSMKE